MARVNGCGMCVVWLILAWACTASPQRRAAIAQAEQASPCELAEKEPTPENVNRCNDSQAERDRDWRNADGAFASLPVDEDLGYGAEGPGARPADAPLTPAAIFQRSVGSIVKVEAGPNLGTGFVVHSGGLIVTNIHVVAGQNKIAVVAFDGTRHPVSSIHAYDLERDLVILRVRQRLPSLAMAAHDDVAPGEHIVAIGNPLGLEASISEGIVSGVRGMQEDVRVIQVTAAISPGSSGGPILDEYGAVIGVSTFMLRGGANLGFGMPVEYVRRMIVSPKPATLSSFAKKTRERAPAVEGVDGKVLAGCTSADLNLIASSIGGALDAADRLSADSDLRVIATVLGGAASECGRKLSAACAEPRALIEKASRAADQAATDTERVAQLLPPLRALHAGADAARSRKSAASASRDERADPKGR